MLFYFYTQIIIDYQIINLDTDFENSLLYEHTATKMLPCFFLIFRCSTSVSMMLHNLFLTCFHSNVGASLFQFSSCFAWIKNYYRGPFLCVCHYRFSSHYFALCNTTYIKSKLIPSHHNVALHNRDYLSHHKHAHFHYILDCHLILLDLWFGNGTNGRFWFCICGCKMFTSLKKAGPLSVCTSTLWLKLNCAYGNNHTCR